MYLHYPVAVLVILVVSDVGCESTNNIDQSTIDTCLNSPAVRQIVTRYICPKPDPCATVDCNCNEKCIDGKCQCKNGLQGEFCTEKCTFKRSENTRGYGYGTFKGVKSLDACEQQCLADKSCVAVYHLAIVCYFALNEQTEPGRGYEHSLKTCTNVTST
ncbi:hypothetical protein LOTGIDRAFT_172854 [Lottia gigantea]|uniref:Apple domain-containing protein n=1 Tax=Lottia gigantea TaxID=225164 RepID=V4AAL1_LOTGI|nr:hypothetical protein LOTGIDRAFT_172854 [Lottia gigantea]ESP01019.1 hypothetical protein LOTGIDRAFT_172854 [Lottia gigantea]